MKLNLTLLLILSFCMMGLEDVLPQHARQLITYSSVVSLTGVYQQEKASWKAEKNSIFLDYEDGSLIIKLNTADLVAQENTADTRLVETGADIILEGQLPVERIINQKKLSEDYQTELLLKTPNFEVSTNFKFTVQRVGQGQAGYTVFSGRGILYHKEEQIELFEGFEDELVIGIFFNVYINE